MELRIDRLLAKLRERPGEILAAIDRDPLLLKREADGLVLANASQLLYTPQAEHQLYAKGVVYRRDPYRLVSLPLVKIYNLGERDVTAADLVALLAQPGARLHFLRKIDGSLVQVFRDGGLVRFTTRGMLEGVKARGGDAGDRPDFDYLGTARRLVDSRYPRLLADDGPPDGVTLVFELIHPGARKVTDYGGREDLVLLAAWDRGRCAYLPYDELSDLARSHGLTAVDALSPRGATLADQLDDLLAALAGTDEEGSVLQVERGGGVVYRVKVKSPEYLQLMRLMTACTYDRTAAYLDANTHWSGWPELEAFLREQGNERVPEEVLGAYREHHDHYRAYLADCEQLRAWAAEAFRALEAEIGGRDGTDRAAYRKAFAVRAVAHPCSRLLFAALDGRLDLARVRQQFQTPDEAREAVAGFVRDAS